MTILHICNDYSLTKVHKNLYSEFDKRGYNQKIFAPLRNIKNIGNNSIDFVCEKSEIKYSSILKPYHRLFFRLKIQKLFRSLEKQIDLNRVDVVHATTLFSDGAIALRVYKKFKKPYIVAVRNTDVNTFLKLRPDLALLGHEILQNAEKIIFISKAIKEIFFKNILIRFKNNDYQLKSVVIFNGVDSFWLNNSNATSHKTGNKLLFIGRFDKNKNALGLVNAVKLLKSKYHDLELTLVGGGGNRNNELIKLISENDWVHFFGHIVDKQKLLEIFRSHNIFAMTSFNETFGLVYIEALTQGLPILYTRGQGIDGVFEENIGVGVNANLTENIMSGIEEIINNYNSYELGKINFSTFDWNNISKTYINIYKNIIEK